MHSPNIQIDAIRTIDRIIETPRVYQRPQISIEDTQSKNDLRYKDDPNGSMDFQEVVVEASKALEVVNTELSFRIHEGTGRPVIQLIETDTHEVIREIPPEKMLDIVAGIWEWAGLIVDRKE